MCSMSAIAAIMIRIRPIKNAILDRSASENGTANVAMYQPRMVKKNKDTFHFIYMLLSYVTESEICLRSRFPSVQFYSDTFSAHFR